MNFDILYKDEHILAIYKPPGYFVHRTKLDYQADQLIMPILRDQIGQKVYPVHRLDRKTSGVLLMALDVETQKSVNDMFMNGSVKKTYQAIVRGWAIDDFEIDYALENDRGKLQEALTYGKTAERYEIPFCSWKHPTSRYSLTTLNPQTGRQHQLRKHLSHIFHPIIGDRPHGCNKQNKFWLEQFQLNEMLLHASEIEFTHPLKDEVIVIQSTPKGEFVRISEILAPYISWKRDQ